MGSTGLHGFKGVYIDRHRPYLRARKVAICKQSHRQLPAKLVTARRERGQLLGCARAEGLLRRELALQLRLQVCDDLAASPILEGGGRDLSDNVST